MSISLVTGSEAVSKLICIIHKVFQDVNGHAKIQHVTYWLMKIYHYIVLGIDWVESTNPVID